jgi:chaperonin cofactor prefoldin
MPNKQMLLTVQQRLLSFLENSLQYVFLHCKIDRLPEEIKDKVSFIGSACLGCDESDESPNPPYAKVGDVLIKQCNEEKLLNEIYSQLGLER